MIDWLKINGLVQLSCQPAACFPHSNRSVNRYSGPQRDPAKSSDSEMGAASCHINTDMTHLFSIEAGLRGCGSLVVGL